MNYQELMTNFVPRYIHNQEEYTKVQKEIDRLVDKPADLTPDESDYLALLGMLIQRYDEDHDVKFVPLPITTLLKTEHCQINQVYGCYLVWCGNEIKLKFNDYDEAVYYADKYRPGMSARELMQG